MDIDDFVSVMFVSVIICLCVFFVIVIPSFSTSFSIHSIEQEMSKQGYHMNLDAPSNKYLYDKYS